jgi:hypothetical protein
MEFTNMNRKSPDAEQTELPQPQEARRYLRALGGDFAPGSAAPAQLFYGQGETARLLGIHRNTLWEASKASPLYAPAQTAFGPKYHFAQIRLIESVLTGSLPEADAAARWDAHKLTLSATCLPPREPVRRRTQREPAHA